MNEIIYCVELGLCVAWLSEHIPVRSVILSRVRLCFVAKQHYNNTFKNQRFTTHIGTELKPLQSTNKLPQKSAQADN
jgi:hypothetical protein